MNHIWKTGTSLVGGNFFTEKGVTYFLSGILFYILVLILKHFNQIKPSMKKMAFILPWIISAIGLAMLLWGFWLNAHGS